MKQKDINSKKILALICYVIIILSGIKEFVNIGGVISLNTYGVKGFSLVTFSFLFFVYFIFTKKKLMSYLSAVFVFIGYLYTFYSVYKVYDHDISFGAGFYLYVISFVLFIVNLLIKFQSSTKLEETDLKQKLSESGTNINAGSYIIGKYLYGLKEKGFSNHYCAVTTNGETKDLILILVSSETLKYEIKYDQLEKIIVKPGLAMKQAGARDIEDYTIERRMLGYALAGIWGSMLVDNFGGIDSTDEIKYKSVYTVEIVYKVDGEIKTIVIELFKNPDSFFECFSDIYHKKA